MPHPARPEPGLHARGGGSLPGDRGGASTLKGRANVLIFPDLGSANIAFKLLAKLGGTETLGPILMGMARPVHLLPRDAEVELIVKVAAIAVVDAQETEQHGVRLERTKALVPAT